MKILITESQLQGVITPYHIKRGIIQNKIKKRIIENWSTLPNKEKKIVISIQNVLHPEHAKFINEARWWNTIGDVVGIFDPTGVVDIVNGLDYFRQGDKLFGMLSLISAVPYIGDLVGKPIIGMMKLGGEGAKLLRGAKTSAEFAAAGKKIPMFGKMLEKFTQIGPKLTEMLNKMVGKVPGLGGMIKSLEEWIKMFTDAAKQYKLPTKMVSKGGVKGAGFTMGALKPVEKIDLLKSLQQIFKPGAGGVRAFRDYKALSPSIWSKYGIGGVGRIWGNRSTRALMRKTKWYLRFLDFVGIKNFVGPDELDKQLGSANVISKMTQFSSTPESTQAWDSDMSDMGGDNTNNNQQSSGFNIGSILGGGSLSPEMMNVLKMMATAA